MINNVNRWIEHIVYNGKYKLRIYRDQSTKSLVCIESEGHVILTHPEMIPALVQAFEEMELYNQNEQNKKTNNSI